MPARAEQRREDRRDDCGIQTIFGRHAGDGCEGDALREHYDRAYCPGDGIRAQRHAIDARPPVQERKQVKEARRKVRAIGIFQSHREVSLNIAEAIIGEARCASNANAFFGIIPRRVSVFALLLRHEKAARQA